MSGIAQNFGKAFKQMLVLIASALLFTIVRGLVSFIGSVFSDTIIFKALSIQILQLFGLTAALLIPLGLMFGLISKGNHSKKLLIHAWLGFLCYWLLVIAIIIVASGFKNIISDFWNIFQLSIWAMLAYSIYAVPLVTLLIFIIEQRSGRKK